MKKITIGQKIFLVVFPIIYIISFYLIAFLYIGFADSGRQGLTLLMLPLMVVVCLPINLIMGFMSKMFHINAIASLMVIIGYPCLLGYILAVFYKKIFDR